MSQPCFLDYQCLAPLLDTHLLKEHVHDYQHHDREKHGIILYLINFKDDEPLIEKIGIPIGVECHVQFTTPVELFQDSREVTDGEVNFLQRHDLRNALQGELIIGIKGEFTHFELPLLNFQMVYLPVYLAAQDNGDDNAKAQANAMMGSMDTAMPAIWWRLRISNCT